VVFNSPCLTRFVHANRPNETLSTTLSVASATRPIRSENNSKDDKKSDELHGFTREKIPAQQLTI
jgi:hypothetical protein